MPLSWTFIDVFRLNLSPRDLKSLQQLSTADFLGILVFLDVLGQIVDDDGRLLGVVGIGRMKHFVPPVIEVLDYNLPVGLLLRLRSAGQFDPPLELGHLPRIDSPKLSVVFQGS